MAEKNKNKAKSAVNKKTGNNKWQVVALVVLIAFFVMSLLFLWVYASNKPNYKDLEKAYSKLNIPSDWQLVSQNSNKGTLGMFCLGNPSDTSPCPQLVQQYSVSKNSNIFQIFNDSGFTKEKENCFDRANNLCNFVFKNTNSVYASVITAEKDSSTIELNIILGNKYGFGI